MSDRRTREALAQQRRIEERARTQLAAGISLAMATVDGELRRFADAVQAESLDRQDVDDDQVRQLAVAIGEAVYDAIATTVGITIRDPRLLASGGIVGPDVGSGTGGVIIDAEHALLLQELVVAQVDPGDNDPDTVVAALALRGRVNHSDDIATITVAADPPRIAMLITQCYALAARGGWTAALDAAVDQQVAALPDPEGTSDQT
jgi:hypothetical protein